MKVVTPEISWHGKDAIFSIDVQPFIKGHPTRLATAGLDNNVRIWQLSEHEVKFLSNLSRHDKAVNVVRFSKSGVLLASGGDDGTIVFWKLSDKEEAFNLFEQEAGKNVEVWNAFKILRGHLEDINDLSWSSDDLFLVSGSVDHTAILWDVEKGQKLAILGDSKHFVNGVAWDPLGHYVATMSCDRSLRIYNVNTKKMVHCVNKTPYRKDNEKSDCPAQKPQRIFHDETVVRRRLSFTVDGKMLITPAGCLQPEKPPARQINTVMIFTRGNLSKPSVYLPGLKEPASIVSCCPLLFELRAQKNGKGLIFKQDYRHLFAVASSDTVLLYDTQQTTPFAMISNIHYASITDLSWSSDASFLAVSSRDGFCSLVYFGDGELGVQYKPKPVSEEKLETNNIDSARKAAVPNSLPINGENTSDRSNKKSTPCAQNEKPQEIECMETDENVNIDLKSSSETEVAEENQTHAMPKASESYPSSSPKPRRIMLTSIPANSTSPSSSIFAASQENNTPKFKTSQMSSATKTAPRRIQLTTVALDK